MNLAVHLEHSGIAGRIVTPVHDVHRKIGKLLAADPDATFGLEHLLPATSGEILGAYRELAGAPLPDDGLCWVDPQTQEAQFEALVTRLRKACENGESVMLGTGHPAGPISLYLRIAASLRANGGRVLTNGENESFTVHNWPGRASVRYVEGVACVYYGGGFAHSHNYEPMSYILDHTVRPQLVIGDHGFAGAALARGLDAIALVDANDPALLLAHARRLPIWPVLCDDNRTPEAYVPVAQWIAARLRG